MKIKRLRIALPPRLLATAANDATVIATALAGTLSKAGAGHGRLRVEVQGHGRAPAQMRTDLANAARGATRNRNGRD